MVRNVYSQKLPEVPFQYREKIFIRSSRAPSKERNSTFNKLTKLKSMNFEKESSSELMLEAVNDKTSLSRTKMKLLPQHDQENPAINKLNQIFNTLFDKKITSKKQIILQEKKSPLKEFFSDPVQNYQFKDKIEKEIERAVDDVIQKNKYKRKRILPTGASKLPTINGDLEPKRELNSVHKVNFMKKTKIKKRNTTDFN